ncbi:hypothetical protein J2Y58_000897 [Sphingomonas sp. BE138]|uniref:I78 family peptidase inhibitor n=1 Tax=Sphingomonas sp. BE138 TaxID=2817845 RepID=UPI002863DDDE|nr:I78 family peptidase inhibitor [Sphingomonas sp. BE138]MDR6787556.1 hypothetical protein [Sphingomonas sp. BE138]
MRTWLTAGMLMAASNQGGQPFGEPGLPDGAATEPSCSVAAAAGESGARRLKPGARLSSQDIARLRDKDPRRIRVLGPNDAGTMDLLPNRLNVHLDAEGRILRLTCG